MLSIVFALASTQLKSAKLLLLPFDMFSPSRRALPSKNGVFFFFFLFLFCLFLFSSSFTNPLQKYPRMPHAMHPELQIHVVRGTWPHGQHHLQRESVSRDIFTRPHWCEYTRSFKKHFSHGPDDGTQPSRSVTSRRGVLARNHHCCRISAVECIQRLLKR